MKAGDLITDDILSGLVNAIDGVYYERKGESRSLDEPTEPDNHWFIINGVAAEYDIGWPGDLLDEAHSWSELQSKLKDAKLAAARLYLERLTYRKVPVVALAFDKAASVTDDFAKKMTEVAQAYREETKTETDPEAKAKAEFNVEVCEKTSWLVRELAHALRTLE